MSAKEIGEKLVALCREGKNMEAIDRFYADDIESLEAAPPPGGDGRVSRGIDAIRGKNAWWVDNHEVHSASVEGPWPNGDDKFAVRYSYDVTFKPASQRRQMNEIAVYTLREGKIAKEEFFYDM